MPDENMNDKKDKTMEKDGKKDTVTLFGREFGKRKAIVAGLGIACAAALAIGGICAVNAQPQAKEPVKQEQAAKTGSEDKKETYVLQVGAKAEGWNKDTSSPVIAHIVNEEEKVDYYTAYDANEEVSLDVPAEGGYEVSFISPVNADGSIYKVPEKQTVQAETVDADKKTGEEDDAAKTAELPFTLEPVKADAATTEELSKLADDVANAVKSGDETLTGEKGVKVVDTVTANIKANAKADVAKVEEAGKSAETVAATNESAAKKPEGSNSASKSGGNSGNGSSGSNGNTVPKPSGNGNSNSNGNGDSGNTSKPTGGNSGGSKPAHTHNWVAQTKTVHHDAQYKTVHHEAQYKTVNHPAVTETRSICNQCGADITGHTDEHLLAGNCESYTTKPVVVQQAWSEQVLVKGAWDEQVQASAPWDETVTTGYKCSGCGATK